MKKRARDLGIPFPGVCGENNGITDVEGVEVGYTTLIVGEPGENTKVTDDFARTGVTAILPRGKVRSAVFAGRHDLNGKEVEGFGFFYPVVGETFDGALNNINGFKVKEEHALAALENVHSGAISEGCITEIEGGYKVGVLVQANHGRRQDLIIRGIPCVFHGESPRVYAWIYRSEAHVQ